MLQAALADLQTELGKRGQFLSREEVLRRQTAALLTGEDWDVTDPDYAALEQRIRIHRDAIIIQRTVVSAIRAEVGAAIGRDLLPLHKANVLAIAKAAKALHEAMEAERNLRAPLELADVPASGILRVVGGLEDPGSLDEPDSVQTRYWKEAHEFGLITEKDLPAIVRLRVSYLPSISAPDQPVEFCEPDGTLPWPGKVAALVGRRSA